MLHETRPLHQKGKIGVIIFSLTRFFRFGSVFFRFFSVRVRFGSFFRSQTYKTKTEPAGFFKILIGLIGFFLRFDFLNFFLIQLVFFCFFCLVLEKKKSSMFWSSVVGVRYPINGSCVISIYQTKLNSACLHVLVAWNLNSCNKKSYLILYLTVQKILPGQLISS